MRFLDVRRAFAWAAVVGAACTGGADDPAPPSAAPPLVTARRLAARVPEVASRLGPAVGSLVPRGGGMVSRGRLSGRLPAMDLGVTLPSSYDGAFEVGIAGSDGHRITLTPVGSAPAVLEAVDGHAVYRGAYAATDAIEVADDRRAELFYVLHGPEAPHTFRWRVETSASTASVRADRSGGLSFGEPGGRPRLRIPRPFAVDASGSRREARLAYEGGEMRIELDPRGLAYPVLLDPVFESVVWEEVVPPLPTERSQTQAALDEKRGVVVLFGGRGIQPGTTTNAHLSDTWEWDGTSWTLRTTLAAPPARRNAAMAYDPKRERIVLFGGQDTSTILGDTWEYDGTDWEPKSTTGPVPSRGAGMAYHAATSKMILFGGEYSGNAGTDDTWSWDGTTWTPECTTACTPPSARGYPAMASYPTKNQIVLFGGYSAGYDDETHVWNGSTWTKLAIAAPSSRSNARMTYDPKNDEILLFGGWAGSPVGETWAFKNGGWAQRITPNEPSKTDGHALAADPKGNGVVFFGGYVSSNNGNTTDSGEMWSWSGATWSRAGAPQARAGSVMVHDSVRDKVVLHGGSKEAETSYGKTYSDTWEFDGVAWTWKPVTGPVRGGASAVFDTNTQKTLMFGGRTPGAPPGSAGDTWTFDGLAWQQVATSGPPGRGSAAMAFDSDRKVTVLFGGSTGSTIRQDTWEWDGVQWNARCTSAPCNAKLPPARHRHSMAYDADRKRVVLFGGSEPNGNRPSSTWEWDGVAEAWNEVCTTAPCSDIVPAGRDGASLTFLPDRHGSLLFAGGGTSPTDENWLWNGVAWKNLGAGGPAARQHHVAAYDASAKRLVVYGGATSALDTSDTWEMHLEGSPCVVASDCPSGNCIGGVCCDVASCSGLCKTCGSAASPGVCTTITNAETPQCSGAQQCDANGTCLLKKGSACSTASQCATGQCVESVCCDAACAGGCATCAASASPGSCGLLPQGVLGKCAPFVCTGSSADCPTSCTLDVECASGFRCSGGACVAAGPTGQACVLPTDCTSGFCVDGVCCDKACNGPCDACSTATKGAAPDGVCGPALPGVVCGATTCSGGVVTGNLCDPTGKCVSPQTANCAPFACDGAGAQCLTVCTTSADCADGSSCVAGTCTGSTPSGQPCIKNSDCSSGFCAGSICCATPCNGGCLSCKAAEKGDGGPDGVCGPLPKGSTCGSTFCATGTLVGSICDAAGNCDPTGSALCAPYLCKDSASCSDSCTTNGDCVTQAVCTSGKCVGTKTPGETCGDAWECASGFCSDGVCCSTACIGVCVACSKAKKGAGVDGECQPVKDGTDPDDDCKPDEPATCNQDGTCDGAGQCRKYPKGTACGETTCAQNVTKGMLCDGFGACGADPNGVDCAPYACKSSHCAIPCTDDTDCSFGSFCDGGTCRGNLKAGEPCVVTSQCSTGFCVDSVCCDQACTGQCEACDVPEQKGKCTPVKGAPHGKRPSCKTDDTGECAGSCDGADKIACVYPGDAQFCGGTSCVGAIFKPQRCNGAGECKPDVTKNCLPYACDEEAKACKTKCLTDGDCASGSKCNAQSSQCVIVANTCKDKFNVVSPDGSVTSCAPYPCSAGTCQDKCAGPPDCSPGFTCADEKCVADGKGGASGAAGGAGKGGSAAGGSAGTGGATGGTAGKAGSAAAAPPPEDDGGCGCRVPGGGSTPGGRAAVLLLLPALAMRRRRSGPNRFTS